jgi:hypothetical protein
MIVRHTSDAAPYQPVRWLNLHKSASRLIPRHSPRAPRSPPRRAATPAGSSPSGARRPPCACRGRGYIGGIKCPSPSHARSARGRGRCACSPAGAADPAALAELAVDEDEGLVGQVEQGEVRLALGGRSTLLADRADLQALGVDGAALDPPVTALAGPSVGPSDRFLNPEHPGLTPDVKTRIALSQFVGDREDQPLGRPSREDHHEVDSLLVELEADQLHGDAEYHR